jgi:RNA polymerase sigma factor (sigma-70 family)
MAEDVAQSVFVMLAERAKTLRPDTVLSGWLLKAARFACSHAVREETRRRARERKAAEMAEDRRHEEGLPPWEPVAGVLDEALSRLRETDRNVILLHYFEDKNFKQVGAALNLRADAVKMRASRALKKLREFLKGRGVAIGLPALGTLIRTNAVQAASPNFAAACCAAGATSGAIAGGAPGAAIPAKILSYARGGLRVMFWAKVKVVATTVLLAVAGSGLVVTAAAEVVRRATVVPAAAESSTIEMPAGSSTAANEIVYRLEQDGRISLAVYDEDGVQVRTLLNAEPQTSGRHTVRWDGLDRDGKPVAPGTYRWKVLQTQGLTAEFLMNIGTSTPEHWPGNHGGPAAALVVGDVLYMTAGNSESPVTTVKLDLATGNRLASWHNLSNVNEIADLAYDDAPIVIPESSFPEGQLYMPVPVDGRVHVVDPRLGGTAVSDYYRGKYENPVFYAPLMQLDFTSTGAPARAGWTAVKPEVYSQRCGFGWESLDGISAFTAGGGGDTTGHVASLKGAGGDATRNDVPIGTLLVDVPVGDWQQYHVVFHLGHPTKVFPQFNVYGGLDYDKPAWIGTVGTAAGDETTVQYDIKPLPGSQLRLAFGPASQEFAGCPIRSIEIMTGPDRVDAHKGRVVIGYTLSNVVQELTANAHAVIASYAVPDLRDVALSADGTIMALAGNRVVKVAQGGMTPLITGLVDPRRLSVDRVTNDRFVVEGEGSWQIKRFNAAHSLQRTYGRKGGRLQGLYVANDFMHVSSIAPDGKGDFVVTEAASAPRRTAHFDGDGKLLREWYGGQLWATNAAVDPKDDGRVWFNSQWGWLIEASVDWRARTWRPRATYIFGGLATGLTPTADGNIGFLRVLYRDGKKYLAGNCNSPVLLRVDERDHRLTPLMAANLNITHYWSAQPPFIQNLLGNARSQYRSYVWNDTTGDREPQAGEVALSSWSMWGPRWVCDDAGVFHGAGTAPPAYQRVSLPPDGRGRYPGFDGRVARPMPPPAELRYADGGLPEPRGLWVDASSNTYMVFEGRGRGEAGRHRPPGRVFRQRGTERHGRRHTDRRADLLRSAAPETVAGAGRGRRPILRALDRRVGAALQRGIHVLDLRAGRRGPALDRRSVGARQPDRRRGDARRCGELPGVAGIQSSGGTHRREEGADPRRVDVFGRERGAASQPAERQPADRTRPGILPLSVTRAGFVGHDAPRMLRHEDVPRDLGGRPVVRPAGRRVERIVLIIGRLAGPGVSRRDPEVEEAHRQSETDEPRIGHLDAQRSQDRRKRDRRRHRDHRQAQEGRVLELGPGDRVQRQAAYRVEERLHDPVYVYADQYEREEDDRPPSGPPLHPALDHGTVHREVAHTGEVVGLGGRFVLACDDRVLREQELRLAALQRRHGPGRVDDRDGRSGLGLDDRVRLLDIRRDDAVGDRDRRYLGNDVGREILPQGRQTAVHRDHDQHARNHHQDKEVQEGLAAPFLGDATIAVTRVERTRQRVQERGRFHYILPILRCGPTPS